MSLETAAAALDKIIEDSSQSVCGKCSITNVCSAPQLSPKLFIEDATYNNLTAECCTNGKTGMTMDEDIIPNLEMLQKPRIFDKNVQPFIKTFSRNDGFKLTEVFEPEELFNHIRNSISHVNTTAGSSPTLFPNGIAEFGDATEKPSFQERKGGQSLQDILNKMTSTSNKSQSSSDTMNSNDIKLCPDKSSAVEPKSVYPDTKINKRNYCDISSGNTSPISQDSFLFQLDPKKYRTELCRSYQVHGYCKYSQKCSYAHGIQQLNVSFRHGKYKTRNCQSYHETGYCRYGARCSFIHDPEEGILKCPITDREVLEALHYNPEFESNSVANITWRTADANRPLTELYVLSKPYLYSSKKQNYVNGKDKVPLETHKDDSRLYLENSYGRGLGSPGNRFKNFRRNLQKSRRGGYNKDIRANFRLNDFLECLQSEGRQHIVPWLKNTGRKHVLKGNRLQIQRMEEQGKYKTELCRSYQYNKACEYGSSCLYAHGSSDLKLYPKHPMYKSKKCYSFHYKGFCLYGSRCQFLHDTDRLESLKH